MVIGDTKQRQVLLRRSSLATFRQQDAVSSSNGCVWPPVRCAPRIFGGGDAQKMFVLRLNLLTCVRLVKKNKHVLIQCSLSSLSLLQQQMVRNQLQQVGGFFFLFFNFGEFPLCVCVRAALSSSGLQFAYRLTDHGQQQA